MALLLLVLVLILSARTVPGRYFCFQHQCEQDPFFMPDGTRLHLEQRFDRMGAHVWDAAVVLARFLQNEQVFPKEHFLGKRVLELGAGAGLVALTAAALGADVTATDKEDSLEILRRNVNANQHVFQPPGTVRVTALSWGKRLGKDLHPPYDVILSSDCIYYRFAVVPLLRTILALSEEGTDVIVAVEKRRSLTSLPLFTRGLQRDFTVVEVDNKYHDPLYQKPDIFIFAARRRKETPIEHIDL